MERILKIGKLRIITLFEHRFKEYNYIQHFQQNNYKITLDFGRYKVIKNFRTNSKPSAINITHTYYIGIELIVFKLILSWNYNAFKAGI